MRVAGNGFGLLWLRSFSATSRRAARLEKLISKTTKALQSKDIVQHGPAVDKVVPLITELGVHPQGRMIVCKAFDFGSAEQRESMASQIVPLVSTSRVNTGGLRH